MNLFEEAFNKFKKTNHRNNKAKKMTEIKKKIITFIYESGLFKVKKEDDLVFTKIQNFKTDLNAWEEKNHYKKSTLGEINQALKSCGFKVTNGKNGENNDLNEMVEKDERFDGSRIRTNTIRGIEYKDRSRDRHGRDKPEPVKKAKHQSPSKKPPSVKKSDEKKIKTYSKKRPISKEISESEEEEGNKEEENEMPSQKKPKEPIQEKQKPSSLRSIFAPKSQTESRFFDDSIEVGQFTKEKRNLKQEESSDTEPELPDPVEIPTKFQRIRVDFETPSLSEKETTTSSASNESVELGEDIEISNREEENDKPSNQGKPNETSSQSIPSFEKEEPSKKSSSIREFIDFLKKANDIAEKFEGMDAKKMLVKMLKEESDSEDSFMILHQAHEDFTELIIPQIEGVMDLVLKSYFGKD